MRQIADVVGVSEKAIRKQLRRLGWPAAKVMEELGRVRASIERMGLLSPVLVATAVEAARIVIVDGFKRVRIATDRGDAASWVRRTALDAMDAKVAMIAAIAGHRGLCDPLDRCTTCWVMRESRKLAPAACADRAKADPHV